ncbi:hypothetical protein [Aquidulcibacter sp.]|uniref:hypothetical protein n=1 Tax=Aquidulcibacter sp. TaxID=2052990 RepID=UPI0025BF96B6|nr:hypothetical protein [Aquidulcibacter sp.]MCA3693170.1 hypothetical protein [Aquidulcibacter sp.]
MILATNGSSLMDIAKQELASEDILWAGQPNHWHAFWAITPLWLFAIPWTLFALFWELAAIAPLLSQEPLKDTNIKSMAVIFPLFGLPFVLIGLGMLAAPLWGLNRAKRTLYVLTDKRLVTIQSGKSVQVESRLIGKSISIRRSEKPDGTGTVHLGFGGRRDSDGDFVQDTVTLSGIPNVRELEELIKTQTSVG